MSETEIEPVETGDETEEHEPLEPLEGDEDEPEAHQPIEGISELVEGDLTPQGLTEKELEAARKKIEAENTRHANRVSEIMGEEAQALEPCPLCSYFVGGFRFPVVPPDDVIEQVRAAIGMPDLSNFQQAKNARQCDDCGGLGVVKSGSLVAGNVVIPCSTCHGSGYLIQHALGTEPVAPTLNGGPLAAEPLVGVNPDDPAVKELRERGFTVIPPMAVTV